MEMRKRSGVPWNWRVDLLEVRLWRNASVPPASWDLQSQAVPLDRKTEDKEVDHAAAVAARGDLGLASCLGALPYATNMCRATMVLTLLPRYEHEEPRSAAVAVGPAGVEWAAVWQVALERSHCAQAALARSHVRR